MPRSSRTVIDDRPVLRRLGIRVKSSLNAYIIPDQYVFLKPRIRSQFYKILTALDSMEQILIYATNRVREAQKRNGEAKQTDVHQFQEDQYKYKGDPIV
jgi:hypothetical protein